MKILLNLALAIIPFLILPGYDSREPKFAIAFMVSLALGLGVFFEGKFKPFKNIWLLLFILWLPVGWYLAHKPDVFMFDMQVNNFWVWKAILNVVTFFLGLAAISSMDFSGMEIRRMFNIMSWAGFIMAIYAILQALGAEQFFSTTTEGRLHVPMGKVGGTLGQPTILAPFLAMIIPLSIYLKKYMRAFVLVLGVCLTLSLTGIIAMVVSLFFLFATYSKKGLIVVICLTILISSILGYLYFKDEKNKKLITQGGRFAVWQDMVKDLQEPVNKESKNGSLLTGFGMGSFYYIFHIKHNNAFFQAHNDYLELFYNTGIVGLLLFLTAIWYMVKSNFIIKDRYRMTLLSSFFAIAICAGGTFIFQLGAHAFYSIVIAGLLHNQNGRIV